MHSKPPEMPDAALRTYVQTALLGGQPVSDDDELLLSGMIDSLGVMSLVSFIEQTFVIEIPFGDVTIENFATIRAMADYAMSRRDKTG